MADAVRMTLAEADALSFATLLANGCDAANARAVTDIMLRAERDICHSHGLFRLPGYVASLRSGKVDGTATPTVEDLSAAVIRVDGKGGYAPLALELGLPILAGRARKQGIAAMAVNDIFHFAALWPEVETLTDRGLVGFAWTAAAPMVAPSGGTKPLFGTNPMAFGWPRPGKTPVIFDQASAAMARGDVMIHARDGKSVPTGVGLDAQGRETTDPKAVLAGAQLPFGGYKGSSIALMVELLAGALIGSVFSYEAGRRDNADGGPPVGGELLIAIDPDRTAGGDWAAHSEGLFDELAKQPGTRMPGERRYRNRTRTAAEGIEVPAILHAEIVTLSTGP